MTTPTFVLTTLTLLSSLTVSAAPTVPDAGQMSRELQKQPELNPSKPFSPLRSEEPSAGRPGKADELRIAIKAILIAGNNDTVPVQELESLVANLIGGEHSLSELDAGAARITAYYHEHDYVVARAYLPEQEIKDGVVVIKVLPGLLGRQHLKNQSSLSDDRAKGYLRNIKPGAALRASTVDRALLLLSDTPGVGAARATLQPGASVGTSDLLIELDPASAYSANLSLDNYGNRYTGEYRMDVALGWNSPLKIGDQLIARALTSGQNMRYARIAYQLPLGEDGMKLGTAYSDSRYTLGREFAALQAHGTATSASVYATYPIVRNTATHLSGAITFEDKTLVDQTGAPASSTNKQVQLVNFGLAGHQQDSFGGAGVTTLDVSLVGGKLNMDAASLAIDSASAQSNGHFGRFTYLLNRQQQMGDSDSLVLALSGQQSSKNLGSSEKFSLGGASGVRAYPQGEGSGDEGWMANLEWRHSWLQNLQSVVFYDLGSVTVNHAPFAATPNTRSIAGAGLGVNAQYGAMQFKASAAWPTSGGAAQSEPATVKRSPRLWVNATGQF